MKLTSTLSLIICCAVTSHAYGTIFIRGNSTTTGLTFAAPVTAEVFDPANGSIYVSSGTSGTFSLASATRFSQPWPQFNGIAGSSGTPAVSLALATSSGVPAQIIAGTPSITSTTIFALPTNGLAVTNSASTITSATLNDAGGALNVNGNTTGGITTLAANSKFIFGAAAPNGEGFGQNDSGVAVISLVFNPILGVGGIPQLASLIQTAAQAGDMGIKAKKVDPTIPEVFFDNTTGLNAPGTMGQEAILYWDDPLQRLYIGLNVIGGTAINDGARSVVVARVNPNGVLTLSPIAPNSAFTPGGISSQAFIVGGVQNVGVSTLTPELQLDVDELKVMHTSTGPSYLIVNGGNFDSPGTTPNDTGAKIFALPLVDLTELDGDITDEDIHGTLAKKDSTLVNGKFVVPATAPADLVQDPTIVSSPDTFALVGGYPLPIDPNNPVDPSDVVVVGDTVYVSLNVPQSDSTESGILYSQARFDATGKIAGWTPWAKRGFPFYGLLGTMNQERVAFFDVDAVTGNIWAIGSDTTQTAAITQWDRGSTQNGLVATVNRTLPNGCTCVLDLDAFTRGFDGSTAYRYALFGGSNSNGVSTVAMALISQSRQGTFSQAPQLVTTDFSLEENFLVTTLPKNAQSLTVLEYSRTADIGTVPQVDYFFAGTNNGLYVFPLGLVSTFGTLDAPPFSNNKWEKVQTITGSIVDIKTLGNTLYVLVSTTSPSQPLSTILYSIPYASTVAAMFDPSNIRLLAQTTTNSFANVQQFNGIQLFATSEDSSTEQIVLATNKGLYVSSTAGGSQTATNDTTAAWTAVDASNTAVYTSIAGMDAGDSIVAAPTPFFIGAPSTVWPLSIQDQKANKVYQRSSIAQLSGDTDAGPFTFEPTNFNGSSTSKAFTTLPSTTSFWSDGARRFFIINNYNVNRLMVSPYNTTEWAVSNPLQNMLSSPLLATVSTFNWVKQIGASGILMVGTNKGVVALE